MTRKNFKIFEAGLGYASTSPSQIESTDYDESVNLVRYKDWVYDIPTGRWVMKLDYMKKGIMLWKVLGCSQVENIAISEMLFYLKNNLVFMKALERARAKSKFEIVNKEEINLFNFEEEI